MKNPIEKILATLALLTLASCSTGYSKKDCEEKDFYELGLKDGKDGKSRDRLEKIRSSCSEHGVGNAYDRYDYGRKVGLAQYCDADRAEDDVKEGKTDSICQTEAVPPYQTAYQRALEKRRSEKQAELDKIRKEQEKLNRKQSAVEGDLNRM